MAATKVQDDADTFYNPWQENLHADFFDALTDWSDSAIKCHYESFNDIQLLKSNWPRYSNRLLLEIGCATGDLFRYLSSSQPELSYMGGDISTPAVNRARQKYPAGQFTVVDTALSNLSNQLQRPGILYCKNVVLHQIDPFGFLEKLRSLPEEAAIIRLRTRDNGQTQLDPEVSCQHHYSGWVPYMIHNIKEVVDHISRARPTKRIEIVRNHMVLGGLEGRCLPKDCYEPETGTAETAILVEFDSGGAEKTSPEIIIRDQKETPPPFTLWQRIRRQLRLRLPGARAVFRN